MQKPPKPLLAQSLTEVVHPDRSCPEAFFLGFFKGLLVVLLKPIFVSQAL